MPKTPEAAAAPTATVAVLTQPRGELLVGQLVRGDAAAVAELIAADAGREATADEIARADHLIFAL